MQKSISRRLALSSFATAALMVPIVAQAAPADEIANAVKNGEVVDLTVTVAENYPAHWPFHPPFKRWTMNWFQEVPGQYGKNPKEGAGGAEDTVHGNVLQSVFPYYSQQYVIDDHTGTQIDYPAHFVPPPDSGLEFANENGWLTGDKYPPERMMGPAVVIDVRDILDQADPGIESLDHGRDDQGGRGEERRDPGGRRRHLLQRLRLTNTTSPSPRAIDWPGIRWSRATSRRGRRRRPTR